MADGVEKRDSKEVNLKKKKKRGTADWWDPVGSKSLGLN